MLQPEVFKSTEFGVSVSVKLRNILNQATVVCTLCRVFQYAFEDSSSMGQRGTPGCPGVTPANACKKLKRAGEGGSNQVPREAQDMFWLYKQLKSKAEPISREKLP